MIRYGIGTGKAMWRVFGIRPGDLAAAPSLDEVQARLDPADLIVLEALNLASMAHIDQRIAEREAERN